MSVIEWIAYLILMFLAGVGTAEVLDWVRDWRHKKKKRITENQTPTDKEDA